MKLLTRDEDYMMFLCIHLASVDGSLHPNERETIQERMVEWFQDISVEKKFDDMETYYNTLGFSVAEELLIQGWTKFSAISPDIKAKLFPVLIDIINSDARVHEEETRFFKTVREWLHSGV